MAKGKKATEIVEEIVKPVCDEMGLILWDVRFEKEGSDWFLRVFIDKDDEGVYIDECVDLSRAVDPLLDEADPIKQSYNFEVSSAGLGRKLTKPFHFEKKIGQTVLARYIRAVDGVKEVRGELKAYNDGVITIEKEDGMSVDVIVKDTSYVKLCDDEDLF
ncbi:MAG: ribosome maturation factor RimP [Oscillospiraceae bacterium]|nr:ribosome maturation factor RimP [Oscillospiraceae bacterium]